MKTIILIIVALLIIGCDIRNRGSKPIVVTSKVITTIMPGPCKYHISIPEASDFTLMDSCNCYEVGDTLDLVIRKARANQQQTTAILCH